MAVLMCIYQCSILYNSSSSAFRQTLAHSRANLNCLHQYPRCCHFHCHESILFPFRSRIDVHVFTFTNRCNDLYGNESMLSLARSLVNVVAFRFTNRFCLRRYCLCFCFCFSSICSGGSGGTNPVDNL